MIAKILRVGLLIVLVPVAVRADEGRIPIFQPTTISSSGSYVVTRDITVASGNVITIQASEVTLDLNGKTLRITSPSDALIAIDSGASAVRVKNGRLIGGAYGIRNTGADYPVLTEVLKIEALSQSLSGIFLPNTGEASVSECIVRGALGDGISITSSGPFSSARVVANVFTDIRGRSISLDNVRSVAVLHNVSSETSSGIQISFSGAFPAPGSSDLVQGNVMESRASVPQGDGLAIVNSGGAQRRTVLVLDNSLGGFARGMFLNGDGFRIAGNVVHRSVAPGGLGVVVQSGAQPLIEGNQIQGNAACGLVLGPGTSGAAYRNNMLRGNAGGAVCDSGAGNTDAGGNIL